MTASMNSARVVPPVHLLQRVVVDCLEPQFHTDVCPPPSAKAPEHLEILPGDAVRPGGDIDLHNISLARGLLHIGSEILQREERVGIILKVGDKFAGFVFPFNLLPCPPELLPHRQLRREGLKSCAGRRAEGASPCSAGPVRTGDRKIDRQFVNFFSVYFFSDIPNRESMIFFLS